MKLALLAVHLLLALNMALSACSLATGTMGGREKCWGHGETRLSSLMKGYVRLDPSRSLLDTPEGETLPLYFSGLSVHQDGGATTLVDRGGAVVANDDELVTVFGGLGADGSMIVCAVDVRH
jgi:hypothetical protein